MGRRELILLKRNEIASAEFIPLKAGPRNDSLKILNRCRINATETSQKATADAYKKASDTVELLVGALGKGDALSKRLRNLRDEIANEALRGKKRPQ